MRWLLQHTVKLTLATALAATLIPAARAYAQGRGRRGAGMNVSRPTAPVGQRPRWLGQNGWWIVMPDYEWSWANYPYNGVAYSPFGAIQYTPCGYGWTLPAYYTPYSDGFVGEW
jgi:hypothetical protein